MHTIKSVLYRYIGFLVLSFGLLTHNASLVWGQSNENTGEGSYHLDGGNNDDTGEGGYQRINLVGSTFGLKGKHRLFKPISYQMDSGENADTGEGGYQRGSLGSSERGIEGSIAQPQQAAILGNYPNPFNPETTIRFEVRSAQQIRLSVFNALGQRVQVLVDRWMETGVHEVRFEGYGLPSGTYFTRLQTTAGVTTRRILLAK